MYRNDRLGKVSFNSPDRGLWGDHEAILKTHLEFRNGGEGSKIPRKIKRNLPYKKLRCFSFQNGSEYFLSSPLPLPPITWFSHSVENI